MSEPVVIPLGGWTDGTRPTVTRAEARAVYDANPDVAIKYADLCMLADALSDATDILEIHARRRSDGDDPETSSRVVAEILASYGRKYDPRPFVAGEPYGHPDDAPDKDTAP